MNLQIDLQHTTNEVLANTLELTLADVERLA